jgi:Rps23 Pro-64 3,4-dihydroxylase Tpa1-like proline 4-hydroxylase
MYDLLNSSLDPAVHARILQEEGLVKIPSFLPAATAERLHRHLQQDVAWDLAYSERGQGRLIKAAQLAGMTSAQIRQAVDSAFREDEGRFRFIYNTMRVVESWQQREFAQHPLYGFAEAVHQPDYLRFLRALTGHDDIQRLSVMAARYLPGHFLTPHDDDDAQEGRAVTWILNLTRDWRAEWGGLLHLLDANGEQVTHSFVPAINTLILFKPPRWHFVSQVANFARQPRYTLTGWMLRS